MIRFPPWPLKVNTYSNETRSRKLGVGKLETGSMTLSRITKCKIYYNWRYALLSILVVMPLSIALTRWYDAHREGLQMAASLIKYGSKLYSHFPNGKSILKVIVEDLHIVRSRTHPHEMCKAFYRYMSVPTRYYYRIIPSKGACALTRWSLIIQS